MTALSNGDWSMSTKRLKPSGITMVSPSIGASSPPQVSAPSLHLKTYVNVRSLVDMRPLPSMKIERLDGTSSSLL